MTAPRYIVTTIAEARASGKRAAGFATAANCEKVCASLNAVGGGDSLRWTIEPDHVAALVDTATAADGRDAPAVNADPWDGIPPEESIVIAGLLELHADHLRWRVCNVYGDNHAHGEGMGLGRNRKAATAAAEALLLAALEELRRGR